jgi:hypothetical protein
MLGIEKHVVEIYQVCSWFSAVVVKISETSVEPADATGAYFFFNIGSVCLVRVCLFFLRSARRELLPYAEVVNAWLIQMLNWSNSSADNEPGQGRIYE